MNSLQNKLAASGLAGAIAISGALLIETGGGSCVLPQAFLKQILSFKLLNSAVLFMRSLADVCI